MNLKSKRLLELLPMGLLLFFLCGIGFAIFYIHFFW